MIENKFNNTILNSNSSTHDKISETKKLFGLWIYLMSDCIMFAVLFAVYAIVSSNISINLISNKIFNLSSILLETFLLLLSSLSCGFVVIAMNQKRIKMIYSFLTITFIFGLIFLLMEVHEFYELIIENFGPDKNAFFSIFFTLVATHGVHIFFGLILILSILYQIKKLGLTNSIRTRILCFSVFWHFLDIIWICVFTFVYLNGAI
ncbi:cytochrome o ubiquinol oxidase subunit III [Buchnera aphidicola str. APS (Acyrthosiphon pisum)]|uniref:Cytochrome bo(3) ubiquinol oxidase subunit 3 n=2 Tax=Buchnera aphidicola TaxID=9 RepID=CYOC_BUCAI|nr:cytochrome o ubiquinol oxidase subunit III [Buchnera aphidicola]P57542.1 RecName: Full=Cytochrome bo(3) ubiquinol oxidase subunit 3; AltName: Full=Cytochrome o ubiquinol oxidase subunit 3; Short=Cytochrome o subunit 3; AltName: Full=Oxidase bo(3) subunit 3; AltName: Full=Ubiquinol oxidase polypeptide III; AltName: Full=Ubiquinol oxidase subunit 3 [Buchnera aphidicola str. APS (Acyrthosiphon pisum)]pir/G84984/ cytochrome o ubiquinol oxidase subunit III [imported] - Buchnera sp. (strain APS) [Bu